MMKNIPAVSIIIPLYNAEKYLVECFESILAQTFQNFEVVVVDDCSTDNSVAIVESYLEKFDGRLILSRMEKNNGASPAARNRGLIISHGEYVFFMDNDDLIVPTALEELYTLAKNYDSDLVYVEKHYEASADLSAIKIRVRHAGSFVDRPTFESEDLIERLKALLSGRFGVPPWLKLVKRYLLLDNEIFFPHTCPGEDDIWTYSLIFYAKKILRVPNAVYVWRISNDSITGKERTPQQKINLWINPLILGLKSFDKLIGKHEFFKSNPQYRYSLLEFFANAVLNNILTRSPAVEPFVFYEAIKQRFGDNLGEHDVLICALCTVLTTKQKLLMDNNRNFNQFAAQTQQRIAELERINREDKAYIAELENFIANELKAKEIL